MSELLLFNFEVRVTTRKDMKSQFYLRFDTHCWQYYNSHVNIIWLVESQHDTITASGADGLDDMIMFALMLLDRRPRHGPASRFQ